MKVTIYVQTHKWRRSESAVLTIVEVVMGFRGVFTRKAIGELSGINSFLTQRGCGLLTPTSPKASLDKA